MDRQTLLFKYYASLAGFDEQQSLYWYFISNFPKATDLSKMIDKNAGVEREVVGKSDNARPNSLKENSLYEAGTVGKEFNITEPKSPLAKKYDGYKYSVAPLKQTCETIMVFKKPNKTGSVLHDTLAMENGDTTISVSALNIDDNRVKTTESDSYDLEKRKISKGSGNETLVNLTGRNLDLKHGVIEQGRYPAQSFVDEQVAQALDLQSGVLSSGDIKPHQNISNGVINFNPVKETVNHFKGDIGGSSKILHKIKYEQYDHDLFIYEPKVGEAERNNGLEAFESKLSANLPMRSANVDSDSVANDGSKTHRTTTTKNNHPTLKPIDLNSKVLKLFKTPNDQKICYPFAGSGSEIIGGLQAGFSNWVACEINEDYIKIANARIKHYTTHEYVEVPLFDE
jgi:site-specific DNA-methyltransferase (adenine-specific)